LAKYSINQLAALRAFNSVMRAAIFTLNLKLTVFVVVFEKNGAAMAAFKSVCVLIKHHTANRPG
jgi:hypothetical protein